MKVSIDMNCAQLIAAARCQATETGIDLPDHIKASIEVPCQSCGCDVMLEGVDMVRVSFMIPDAPADDKPHCKRCGNNLDDFGCCTNLACMFAWHMQYCSNGWYGYAGNLSCDSLGLCECHIHRHHKED